MPFLLRIELNKEKQVYCLYLLLMVRLVISGCLHAWHLITVPQKSNNCKSLALCLAQWLSSFFFFSLIRTSPTNTTSKVTIYDLSPSMSFLAFHRSSLRCYRRVMSA